MWWIVGCALLLWLFTGGFYVQLDREYGPTSQLQWSDDVGARGKLSVFVLAKERRLNIPLLLWYRSKGAPYVLRVDGTFQDVSPIKTLHIQNVTLMFADGRVERHRIGLSQAIRSGVLATRDSSYRLHLHVPPPIVIDHSAVSWIDVQIECDLVGYDGHTTSLILRDRASRLAPTWSVMPFWVYIGSR